MIICRVCAIAKSLIEYPNHKAYANGKETRCKSCLSEYRKRKWQENLEKSRGYGHKYKSKNRQLISVRNKEYVLNNPKKRKQTMHEYRQRTKPLQASYTRKRQAAKMNRTPAWLTDFDKLKIKCIYSIAAMLTRENKEEWTVDHIIPLQGKLVSGLHVPSNLQVMRGSENYAKINKFEVSV